MPPIDEGSYLFMPTTMPHASIGEALDIVAKQDAALRVIPEVESVVGKIGRAESALDPAPVGMIETVINYKSEYATGKTDGVCSTSATSEPASSSVRTGSSWRTRKGGRTGSGATTSAARTTSGRRS